MVVRITSIKGQAFRGKIARLKCTSDDWENMHRTAHKLGLRTTATMMFGHSEELRHRINHLERVRLADLEVRQPVALRVRARARDGVAVLVGGDDLAAAPRERQREATVVRERVQPARPEMLD